MKMTCLHMEFVLIFITGPSRAKLDISAWQQLLELVSLPRWISSWSCVSYLAVTYATAEHQGRLF